MYGSGVWGTKTFSVISSVQNRACKYFLSVGKHTSNVSSRGDMGWTSCYTKQRIHVCRLLCRTLRSEDHRLSYKIYKWISRRRKGWAFEVDKIVNTLNVRETIYNLSFSTKSVMKTVSEKLIELDNTEWYRELFNDRRNGQNGSKLRTYRLYKHDAKSAPYVLQNISRFERRTMALFRSGALPLAYETGRYSRPPVSVDDRLCVYCNSGRVENEKHFLMECNLYDDLRYNLFFEISKFVDNFHTLDIDTKFVKLMTCLDIQHYFCKILNKFYFRRKLFSQ